ncbi:phage portal protein [Bradyrhizobium diazoefficiens]|nr:phage portal protein [Bradyrhizobium diazoefficiens]MBR0778551.1 phage portal protein [Bradyrhizobium diazoefficiens]
MWPFTRNVEPPSPPSSEASMGGNLDLHHLADNVAREFHRSMYLWRSVDLLASMASSVPLIVSKQDDAQLTAAETDVVKLLASPNPQWHGPAMTYFVAACIAVTNRAFLLRVRGQGGATLELWPLPPNSVTPICHREGGVMIVGFDVQIGGEVTRYPVDENGDSDIIFIRRPTLNGATASASPATVAAPSAEVFTRLLQRCGDILSNASNLTGILSTDSELPKITVEGIKQKLDGFKIGRKDSGGTIVAANAKWELTRLSEDPTAALSVEVKNSLAHDVCAVFGVPSQLAGLPGQETFNNYNEARIGLLTDAVLPGYIGPYTAALTQALMTSGAIIVPNIDAVPAMMAYRAQLTKTANEALFMSINEQRNMCGMPAYEDDEYGEFANVPVRLVELLLKRQAIELQGGNVENILAPAER